MTDQYNSHHPIRFIARRRGSVFSLFLALAVTSLSGRVLAADPVSSSTNSVTGTSVDTGSETGTANKVAPKSTIAAVVDDSIITTKIKASLLTDGSVNDSAISVETNQGTVLLSGFANTPAQSEQAEKIATHVDGVKSVVNKIALRK